MPIYRIKFIGNIEIAALTEEDAEGFFECVEFPKGVEIGTWKVTTVKQT